MRPWIRGWPARAVIAAALAVAACATQPPPAPGHSAAAILPARELALGNRLSWGLNATVASAIAERGPQAYLESQLKPPADDGLPAEIAARIAEMEISRRALPELVTDLEVQRKDVEAIKDDAQKKTAQEAYQKALNTLATDSASRSLLRAIYSPWQLREQMTWFWMNHFSVYRQKSNLRALVGDYEEHAIRPHALGRFRDLVMATLRHPAMIRYLDNEQNAAGRINENYARELLELHTLGVDGGYSQADVQELARVLTGVGVNLGGIRANTRSSQYVRDGLFEFLPARHDAGAKKVLGHAIPGAGMAEVEQVVDILARHPSTARFVSRKLAVYFVADDPPAELVDRMAATFTRSDGDIAEVLRTMVAAPQFAPALGHQLKDPMHYVVSAVRLAYEDRLIVNTAPLITWLNRLGEAPCNRATPDGYPLVASAWSSSGQLGTRFEIARTIGGGSAGLFRAAGPNPVERPAFPRLANALYFRSLEPALGEATRVALEQATSPQEWNLFLLSSPDFMYR